MPTIHCCRLCGATSYRPVLARQDGAMRPSGLYRCSGCSVVFEDPKSWREAGPEWVTPGSAPVPLSPPSGSPTLPSIVTPTAPDFATYGMTPQRDG